MTVLLGCLWLLLLLYHLDSLDLWYLGWQRDYGPGAAVAEVEFFSWELAGSEELGDVGAGVEGLACALSDVDLGDWDLVLALGGEVMEEPEA